MKAPGRLLLRILSGERAGNEVEVQPPGGAVGRDADCVLMLPEATVSRHHAELFWDGRRWWVEDAASHNGTFLEGARLGPGPVLLEPRGKVAFGETEIAYRVEGVRPADAPAQAVAAVSETMAPPSEEAFAMARTELPAAGDEGGMASGCSDLHAADAEAEIQALRAENAALERRLAELQAASPASRPLEEAQGPLPGGPGASAGAAAPMDRIAALLDEFGMTLEAVLTELQRAGGGPARVRELMREACVRLADARSFLDVYRLS